MSSSVEVSHLKEALGRLSRNAKLHKKDWSEEDLRVDFVRNRILDILGFTPENVRFEKTGPRARRRTDIQCFDDFGATVLVIEFKRPSDNAPLRSYLEKVGRDYVFPLRASFALLTDGITLILSERVGENLNEILSGAVDSLAQDQYFVLQRALRKPVFHLDKLTEIGAYLRRFESPEDRRDLTTEYAVRLFLDDFSLREGSKFGKLVENAYRLFDGQYGVDRFVSSAFDFWQRSFARKPERIPERWRAVMRRLGLFKRLSDLSEPDLHRFMFSLETAYALLTRLIVAKTAEDYEFPGVRLFDFLEADMKTREYKGEITAVGWGISLVGLMDRLRYEVVESIFEEDIFYWWIEPFQRMRANVADFRELQYESILINFSLSIRDILLSLQMYDFSRIKGDPLGDLYQSFFDRETRKALGEFYTPKPVVDFILDEVGYRGPGVTTSRLLDPATGSGTFIVEALRRYLSASVKEAKTSGWGHVLRKLTSEFRIVALDIHPFATIMAQIRFVLELLPYYKEAIEEARGRHEEFTIKRLPIFRTDSLVDESQRKRTDLASFVEEVDEVLLTVPLPLRGEDPGEFVDITVRMPRSNEVWRNTDLTDVAEYFNALQALFDTVKERARKDAYTCDHGLLVRNLMSYLQGKNFENLANFLAPYCDGILGSVRDLTYRFGDGRLVKSIEDVMLAGLLKNYVKYDYVVGNPPYIRIQRIPSFQKAEWANYKAATGNYDIYVLFIERGLDWLEEDGELGYITSNRFAKVNYGIGIRQIILRHSNLETYIDFRDTGVFKDALNYPAIFTLRKTGDRTPGIVRACRVRLPASHREDEDLLTAMAERLARVGGTSDYWEGHDFDCYGVEEERLGDSPWLTIPKPELDVLDELRSNRPTLLNASSSPKKNSALSEGSSTGRKRVFVVKRLATYGSRTIAESAEAGEIVTLETGLLVPYAEDAGRWIPEDAGYLLILPYRLGDESQPTLLAEDELRGTYPLTYDYLNHYEGVLRSRKNFGDSPSWYAFSAPRNLRLYGQPKLLVQGFSKRPQVSIDKNGLYSFGPDIYSLSLTSSYEAQALVLVGILNSSITDFFIRESGVIHGSSYYKFEDRFLKHLPIPSDEELASAPARKLAKVAETLTGFEKIRRRIAGFPSTYFSFAQDMETTEIRISLGGASRPPDVIQTLEGGYALSIGRDERNLELKTEAEVDYVLESLSAAVSRDETELHVLIPKNRRLLAKLLEDLSSDREGISHIDEDKLLKDLDGAAQRLYGLGPEEAEVIDRFLARFGRSET